MKVLQINTVVSFGSTGRICRDIADILSNKGHDSLIAYGRGDDVEGYQTYKMGNKWDNYYHYAQSYLFNRNGFSSKKATENLLQVIEDYNPDIIQLHNLHGYYLNTELLFDYLKKRDKPVVWLLHDQWAFSGGAANFEFSLPYEDAYTDKNIYPGSLTRHNASKMIQAKNKIFSQLDNMTIITPSQWLRDMAKQTFLNKYPIKTIYNGIDLEKFHPIDSNLREKYALENKVVILGVASEWDVKKGIEFFQQAAKELNADYKIVLIGVDEKQKQAISGDILLFGRTNNVEELAQWYTSADMLVNPTIFDNFPSVNLEAIACGTPVLTYDTGGSAESVLEGITGEVIARDDTNALLQAIQEWGHKNPNTSLKCLDQSKKFAKELAYEQYLDLYQTLNSAMD